MSTLFFTPTPCLLLSSDCVVFLPAGGATGGVGSLVNYGALAQTWEAPSFMSPETGFGGDNDPIDVLEVKPVGFFII